MSDDLVERLRNASHVPSAYDYVGDNIEHLFDPGLRHKIGKVPTDYLGQWLSMLRPFAYATQDDSWGEMEKLLCIVLNNYVRNKRMIAEAADALAARDAEIARLKALLEEAKAVVQEAYAGEDGAVWCKRAANLLAKLENRDAD